MEASQEPPLFCIHCGARIPDPNASFCIICGKHLHVTDNDSIFVDSHNVAPPVPLQKCEHCGLEIFKRILNQCLNCKAPLEKPVFDPEKVRYSPVISILMPIVGIGFLTLVLVGVTFILMGLNPQISLDSLVSQETLIGLFLELLFIVPPLLYFFIRKTILPGSSLKDPFLVFGLPLNERSRKKLGIEIGIGVGIAFLLVIVVIIVQYLSQVLWAVIAGPQFVTKALQESTGSASLTPTALWQLPVFWAGMIGAVGVSEEILFRGFTQRGLVKSWGKVPGILMTALLFTFAHVTPVVYSIPYIAVFFLPYFSISIILGYLREWRRGNLLANIFAHGVYDSIIITLAFFGI